MTEYGRLDGYVDDIVDFSLRTVYAYREQANGGGMALEYPCAACGMHISRYNYCSGECVRASVVVTDIRRMLDGVVEDPVTHCWTWVGALSNGYPVFTVNGKTAMTRRFAAKALLGIDYGTGSPAIKLYVVCQNKVCVRPDHIIWDSADVPADRQFAFARKYGIQNRSYEAGEARRRLTAAAPPDPRAGFVACRRCNEIHAEKLKYCMSAATRARKIQDFYDVTDFRSDGHWIWGGRVSATENPFGVLPINGHPVPATRVALAFFGDGTFTLDSSKVVKRTCDESMCVAPDHLELVERGSWNKRVLSDEDRRELAGERRSLGTSYAALARDYGISAMTARKIVQQEGRELVGSVR